MKSRKEIKYLGNYPEHEANFIISILESYNIPTLRKYPETGGYLDIYMGYNAYGVDIYVPESEVKKARNILKNNQERNKTDNNSKQEENRLENRSVFIVLRSIMKGILILFIIFNIGFLFFKLFILLLN